ncbi:Phox (PX) domain-containing protein [Actinidia rufa]|uniref:Phox (PX) domain-containing protein n=1 Tax=Actinidia rufa TaxID=165716 RepID=A0A7J0FYJ3_9ERIC|nr:Phox (PX) domain-containing protein [Actinidia rufa]
MNGEGTGEAPFKFSSPDPIDELVLPWETQKSNRGDESPVGSQYSSCGDSEFERYCSANSVMGTPNVGSLENISLGGGFARKFGERKLSSSGGSGCLSDHRIDSCEGKNISEVRNDVEGQVLVGINDDIECSLQHDSDHAYTVLSDGETAMRYAVLQSSAGTLSAQQIPSLVRVEVETHSQINIEPVNNCLEDVCSHSVVEYNERDGGRCFDEDNASSRFEHSEGEDSMFGYDIEDEQKIDLVHQRNMQYHQNAQVEKENSLFMCSSVAFGSDDWDDFEQETRESDIPSTETRPPAISPDQDIMMDVSVPTDELADVTKDSSLTPYDFQDFCETGQGKDAEDIRIANNQAGDLNESVDYLKKLFCRVSECQESEKSTLLLDPLPDVAASQLCSASTKTPEDQRTQNLELNELYNDVVHEMEEILLDSTESPGARFTHGDTAHQSYLSLPSRDGGSTASTSGNDDTYLLIQRPLTIDGVEVVGAKQKKGDVSFSERLVGVKEYTAGFFLLPGPLLNANPERFLGMSLLMSSLKEVFLFRIVYNLLSTLGTNTDNVLTLGKTISLVVEIRPYKSIKQIQEAQHNTCAACHKHFDDGKTRMLEFVQTLGWGKPRLCEYTGQLFCSSCHTNEIAVLPARVLHHWDFTPHPVSQLAKSYLDSIHDKPMLCVSAVNPILFSKVPALVLVTGVRKRIGAMLPYVHCPFRMSIYKGLASRRYLLESNDFFALRDLIDLSKGPFAVLPVMVETVSRTILEHITEQCLVCCDVGVPCNARQACDDPSSLIFPFQEGEIERCSSCKSGFHKPCFRKITSCPCGQPLKQDGQKGVSTSVSLKIDDEMSSTVDFLGRKSDSNSTMRFLSGLFTKARQEKLSEPKDGNTTILMGSLPCTSL